MYNKISKLKHWRALSGLSLVLLLLLISFMDTVWNTGAAGAATDAYYTLKPGETLDEVARHFELATRTLRCANPGYRPGDRKIILPLTSARRHQVQPGETLAKIAAIYDVTTSVITDFPLNYWQGCAGAPGLGSERADTQPPAGIILYIPEIKPLRIFNSQNSLLLLPSHTPRVDNDLLGTPNAVSTRLPQPTFGASATPGSTPTSATSSPVPTAVSPTPELKVTATPSPTLTPAVPPPAPKPGPLIWPIHGIITTQFSRITHPGIDIATAMDTPVRAAQSGLVYFCSWSPYGYGNFIQIEHGDGRQTHYAHLSRFAVKYGDFVQQGQVIGYEGSTGNSTGPHLHFELVLNGELVNPILYLPKE